MGTERRARTTNADRQRAAQNGTSWRTVPAGLPVTSNPRFGRRTGHARSVVLLSKLKLEVLVFEALFCAFKRTRETQKS